MRRWRLFAAAAAGALLLAACGEDEGGEDTAASDEAAATEEHAADEDDDLDDDGHDDEDHAEDDYDGSEDAMAASEEVPDPQPRLVVADAADAVVHVVDLATEEVLASFDTRMPGAALYLGSEQRVVAAVQTGGDTVQFIAPGTWAVDHGDHNHYYIDPPRLLDARLDTGTPIHTTADLGRFAIFGDDEGAGFLIDELALLDYADIDGEVLETDTPHHGGVVQLSEELTVISGPEDGQDGGLADEVWVFHDGERVGEYDCPGLHGEMRGADWTAFACADRILLLEAHGDHAHGSEVFYPEELGEDFRLGYLRTGTDSNIFVSSRDDMLAFIDADAQDMTIVELPSETATRSTVDDDGNVLVLTDDGILHLFDLDTAELVASSGEAVTIEESEDAARFSIVGGRDRAYVPSPSEGVVHEFASNDDLRLARTMELGGAPANLVFVGAWPR